ncbi:G5 domain-containing protein [Georgenia sp. SUBG003]|uniref:aggregation-promoting factor C-terminal-like domain-containing protein n=1 Tax=Georgenia sp. SUBG003 TaxID=1497974 RepID=UPI000694B5EB
MARHTAERGTAALLNETTPAAGAPAPGTRRALRLAEEQRAAAAEEQRGSIGLPGLAVKAMRGGVLGAVVLGTGAFAVTQGPAQAGTADGTDLAVEAGTLALRDGDTASRSQLAGRLALEADGASTFTVSVDGEARKITTTAATLGEALREAGIVVGGDDVVTASLGAAVPDGQTVEILRASAEHVTEESVVKHGVVEKEDDSLPEGERKVETEGVDGVTTNTYRVVTAGDEEVSRELVATVVSSAKVDEVVLVGTKKAVEAPAPAASYSGDPRAIGRQLAAARGWGADQFTCLDNLWTKESNWSVTADNPTSSAYGIPQALPGSKMASAGADWATNPATQITWGLGYIAGRYGTPCGAWSHSQSVGWY